MVIHHAKCFLWSTKTRRTSFTVISNPKTCSECAHITIYDITTTSWVDLVRPTYAIFFTFNPSQAALHFRPSLSHLYVEVYLQTLVDQSLLKPCPLTCSTWN